MNKTKLCNLVCVALMVILLVLQFTPFWHYGAGTEEAGSVSISQLMWTPDDCKACIKEIQASIKGFGADQLLYVVSGVLVFSLGGILMCYVKRERAWTGLFPTMVGISGTIGYLKYDALQMGSLWVLHLLLSVALLAGGVYLLVINFTQKHA